MALIRIAFFAALLVLAYFLLKRLFQPSDYKGVANARVKVIGWLSEVEKPVTSVKVPEEYIAINN